MVLGVKIDVRNYFSYDVHLALAFNKNMETQ